MLYSFFVTLMSDLPTSSYKLGQGKHRCRTNLEKLRLRSANNDLCSGKLSTFGLYRRHSELGGCRPMDLTRLKRQTTCFTCRGDRQRLPGEMDRGPRLYHECFGEKIHPSLRA